ncbi:uncharacterized protein LOC125670652 isoform X3 [Ostrea edulis]|uniref:uncharacterized protein LOC125670652 isoform X3 n=1 Tax=Ostrea edulis TaxID=37623 RepID=UPI0024AEA33D|nr:uncharacterized protein LOC125670652 isoform X3 [Ostrea edulis]
MSSEAVVKCVAKKLKYYFDVRRLEDGFDLSGVNCPQLDHPPLKSRPTLQYDGLHDRALKHYFSLPEVRVKLTQMGPDVCEPKQKIVKKKLKRHMVKHHFLLTRDPDVEPLSVLYGPPKSPGSRIRPSTLPEYAYMETREGRRLRRDMTGFGVLMQSQRSRALKGGWPLLRSVPTHNVSRSEAKRLVDAAAEVLVATEHLEEDEEDKKEKNSNRPQSAPKPFEHVERVDRRKYTWDIHGRRHKNDSKADFRSESPVLTPAPPPDSPEPEPKKVRPRSAKRRQRQKTVIEVNETRHREEVSIDEGTQTMENGNQTDHQLLRQYNYLDEEVTSGERAEYQIYVRTGNRIGASTKAEVKLTLYGERGRSKEIVLDKSKRHKVCFQKGKEDLFIVAHHHVGKLLKVKIGHDRADASNAWFLESVTVFDMHSKKIYEFVCDRWLSGVDGDHKTYRDLLVDRDRAFIQALEEESEDDHKSDRSLKMRSPSPAVQGSLHDDHLSIRSNQGSYTDTKSDGKTRHSRRHHDSGSDSESLSSYSSSSSSTETYTTTTTTTTAKRDRDEFYDDAKGPTFTMKTIKGKPANSDSGPRGKTVSVESSSQDGKEFVHGYESGLKAVEEEKRRKREEENDERRRLLRGPTIHEAAERGNLNRVQELLTHFSEMKDNTNEQGLTPLHLAAKFGRVDIVKWLTINDVNLNRETPQGYSPIHLAAMNGHVNCLMVLHAMGAILTCRTLDKKTPLHLAAMNGHVECVKWLVANRGSLSVKDDMGRTPREIAEEFHHEDVLKFLKACEEELENPSSGFAQLRNPTGQGLPTIDEDLNSDEKPVWKDDNKAQDDEDSHSSQKEKEERKKIYDDTHKKMEQNGDSFLESIQREFEGGPGP